MIATDLQRTEESFNFSCEITKPYGQLDHVLKWCKLELRGDWRWCLVSTSNYQDPGKYMFYFDDEKDALAFNLKWL